jgi:hypothetical protein
MDRYAIEALDRTLRDIMKQINSIYEEMPFGNMIFSGDFRQILPVILNGTEQDIFNHKQLHQLWLGQVKFSNQRRFSFYLILHFFLRIVQKITHSMKVTKI